MTDPVRIGGFFANFDTEAVIQQMTFARQGAIRKLDIQTTKANAQKGVIAGIQASLSALLARATLLMGTSSVTGKKSTVTNPTNAANAVSAAPSPTSTTGSFTVDVLKLATSSRVAGTAISAGIDATSPVALSNFGISPTNGKFTMSTATGGSATFTIGAQAAQPATLLNASNLALAPTNGTFTIATATGGSTTLTINVATQTLQDVVTAINGTATGITASITNDANGRANVLTMVSTQGNITLGAVGDTSNLLAALNLPAGAATSATVASSAAFTKQMSLSNVIADINGSAIGVTASIVNDANGRPNILTLASAQGALSLGNATDTSNFLSATNLLASPLGATRSSTNSIARLSQAAKMDIATFQGGAPAAGAHSFTINGATINYNTASDSVADIIARITSSAAGVTARYDSTTDTVKLQQVKTGTLAITMAEDGLGGNLLAKLGLLAGTSTLGESAQYKIDGGATQLSATNTVTTGTGVSLTFAAETGAGTPATVVVAQDDAAALTSVKAFVTEFNKVLASIASATKADGLVASSQSGVLSGDATLRTFRSSLRGLISSSALNVEGNFSTLGQIGLSFGAIGAAVGSTGSLVLDEAKFQNTLTTDPASVQSLLSTFQLSATLTPGGTSSLSSIAGTFGGQQAGKYLITDDGAGNITSTFTPVNGGPPSTQSAIITANGTNNVLVPGITLSFAPVLTAGTHTIVVAPSREGIGGKIRGLLDVQAGAGGVMQKRQDRYGDLTKNLETQKAKIQDHIDAEMANLRRKFAAMERAQARAQQIQGSLTQMMAQLSANKA